MSANVRGWARHGKTRVDEFAIGTTVITATGSEINQLGGSGVVTTDLTKLHGVSASAADLNLVSGFAAENAQVKKVVKVALTAGTDTAGGLVSWQNPESGAIIINKLTIDLTTVATGACTVNAGTTVVSGTTSSSNLLTTLDVHSATGTFDNFSTPGASGKDLQRLASGGWVTLSTASGASAGLVANVYIEYFKV